MPTKLERCVSQATEDDDENNDKVIRNQNNGTEHGAMCVERGRPDEELAKCWCRATVRASNLKTAQTSQVIIASLRNTFRCIDFY